MNQEQNNLNPNNFNTQGNNGIPNNQNFNSKPPKKMNLLLIIGIIAAVAVAIVVTLMLLNSNTKCTKLIYALFHPIYI